MRWERWDSFTDEAVESTVSSGGGGTTGLFLSCVVKHGVPL